MVSIFGFPRGQEEKLGEGRPYHLAVKESELQVLSQALDDEIWVKSRQVRRKPQSLELQQPTAPDVPISDVAKMQMSVPALQVYAAPSRCVVR